jgi:hypothetical protein
MVGSREARKPASNDLKCNKKRALFQKEGARLFYGLYTIAVNNKTRRMNKVGKTKSFEKIKSKTRTPITIATTDNVANTRPIKSAAKILILPPYKFHP